MKIVVALKQVPESGAPIRIAADGKWIEDHGFGLMLNEPDAYALEQALLLKEQNGGEVLALTIGPSRAEAVLRDALAKGADRALHIVCDDLPHLDALAIARLLAAALKPEGPDIVLTGLQSDDMGHGQTGVLLAELLGLPHASLILLVEKTATGITVKRELEEGWFQTIELPAPAVLTIQSGGSKLRYATLLGIKRARSKEFRSIPASDLGAPSDPVAVLESVSLVRKQKSTQFLSGTPAQAAAALVEKLQFEARVL